MVTVMIIVCVATKKCIKKVKSMPIAKVKAEEVCHLHQLLVYIVEVTIVLLLGAEQAECQSEEEEEG